MSDQQVLTPWWDARRAIGFRFSATDFLAVVVCGIATGVLLPPLGQWAWICPIVLGHFFLFCNTFRVGTTSELIWAGAFLINVVAWVVMDRFTWPRVLAVQTPLTLILILRALWSITYHGIGCLRINPRHCWEGAPLDGRVARCLRAFVCRRKGSQELSHSMGPTDATKAAAKGEPRPAWETDHA